MRLTLLRLLLLLLLGSSIADAVCGDYTREDDCYNLRGCNWDGDCYTIPAPCGNRTYAYECRRDGLCTWDSDADVCLTSRATAASTSCRIYTQATACESDALCEFDLLTETCIEDRLKTCHLYQGDPLGCTLVAGCAWTGSKCSTMSRDYSVICGTACEPGLCTLATCEAISKNQSTELLQWQCNRNREHPFSQYCLSQQCKDDCEAKGVLCEVVATASPFVCNLKSSILCPAQRTKPRCESYPQCVFIPVSGCVSLSEPFTIRLSDARLGSDWGIGFAMLIIIFLLIPVICYVAYAPSQRGEEE